MTVRGSRRSARQAGPAVATWLLLVCAFPLPVYAQDGHRIEPRQISATLERLQAADWPERSAGFYVLLDLLVPGGFRGRTWLVTEGLDGFVRKLPESEDRIRTALIALLAMETAAAIERENLPEDYLDYRGDLTGAVAGLRDRRAIDVLAANIGTGNMATRALAAFGVAALDAILVQTRDADVVTRNGAVRALGQMAESPTGPPLESRSVDRITNALMTAAEDPAPAIRLSAVVGLGHLPGERVTAILRTLADRDPFRVASTESAGGYRYPIREEARRALNGRGGEEGETRSTGPLPALSGR